MNRQAKKARAKRRSQQYEAERVLYAILHGPRRGGGRLRHGNTWTFYDENGKPSKAS